MNNPKDNDGIIGVKGFKVFNPDWTCRGFKFEVGQTYEEDVKPIVCESGFHFCEKISDCFNYYRFDSNNKVAEVVAIGEIDSDGTKSCTNKIVIVREIQWEEVLRIANQGRGCTGLCNSGDFNSGNHNSGDRNSGNRNSGDRNSGDFNSGDFNSGDFNSGNHNSGDRNSGNGNSGDHNSGYRNSGNRNSGDFNSGGKNSGDFNSGGKNSGDFNSGNHNSGSYNSGDWNSGDWNKTCFSNGCFNTESQKIFLFNKPSGWTYLDWLKSGARQILNDMPVNTIEWVLSENMTDAEKNAHPEHQVTGGYLKPIEKESGAQAWWDSLFDKEQKIVKSLPNFDKAIFKEITGIDVS